MLQPESGASIGSIKKIRDKPDLFRRLRVLATHLHLLGLDDLALAANNCLGATISLTERLLKVLPLLGYGNNASLLHFAAEAANHVFE